MSEDLYHLADYRPVTFRQGLQLIWLAHLSFVHEGRYAMALGRLDQILYPLYRGDVEAGRLSYEEAVELLAATFLKIGEARWRGGDDVVNICIGGVTRQGADATNELSYAVLEAVGRCNIPGPNLSARIHGGTPPRFLDACLQVIGTGLGYPALMNDEVNIPALARHGYRMEDCRDYCMVGCIENFLQGRQPPWSDGRFNAPLYLEAVWNRGRSLLDGALMQLRICLHKTQIPGDIPAVILGGTENLQRLKGNELRLHGYCHDCSCFSFDYFHRWSR